MIKVTGSKCHRVWKCPASAVLPQVDRGDLHAVARGKGKDVHRFLERVGAVGSAQAIQEAPEAVRPLLNAIDLDTLPVQLATEVAFAWNWRKHTARELGRNLDRAYHLADPPVDPDSEIACTLDLVGVETPALAGRPGGSSICRGYVGDYKTGHTKYPAPDFFGQTLLGALCVRDLYQCDDVVVELIHIKDNGDNYKVRRTVDEWDLDVFARELTDAMLRANAYSDGQPVAMHEGVWCEHCDAFKSCPAKFALVRSIPNELVKFGIRTNDKTYELEVSPNAITVRNAGILWMALERIADVVNRAKDEIIGMGCVEEVPLPDGRVIGRIVTERRQVTGQVGLEVLEKRYGREKALKAVKVEMSISGIEQVVVANLKPGEKCQTKNHDGMLDRVMAEIDRAGGLTIKSTEKVAPHVPKVKR